MAVSSPNKHLEFYHGRKYHGLLLSLLLLLLPIASAELQLVGFRPQAVSTDVSLDNDGVYQLIPGDQPTSFLLFAFNLSSSSIIKFTASNTTCDSQDHLLGSSSIAFIDGDIDGGDVSTYQLNISFLGPTQQQRQLYFCIKDQNEVAFVHQGTWPWVRLTLNPPVYDPLPIWLKIVFALILLCFSGLFSGLNLGLMALDPVTLQIVMKSGTNKQKWAARTIYRVRRHGNYLLCTLLLGNVLVNSAFTILLGDVLTGPIAIAGSTLAIVIFGEIVPQAICSRYGLYIGAYTIPLTYIFMVLTFPLSLPISIILNFILGKEIGAVYKREQILELLHVTQKDAEIDDNELNIISGALKFKDKQVKDVMTKMENVFCVDVASVLDFKTMKRIYDSGFSRIPIYEGEKTNVVGVLYLRDLTFIDPDDCTPVKQIRDYYDRKVWFVWDDSSLNDVLLEFVEGTHHLAVVQTVIERESGGDNYYSVLGVITLEDVIEEILGREIVDEYDRYRDNVTLKPLKRKEVEIDVGEDMYTTPLITLSAPQLLAVKQFLSGTKAFSNDRITKTVLHRLLQQDIVFQLSVEECRERDFALYREGTPANYFALVLEGCLNVSIGSEGMKFEARAFYHFGEKCLLDTIEGFDTTISDVPPYIPDFTVHPVTDSLVLIITRRCYLAAYNTSLLEKEAQPAVSVSSQPSHEQNGDVFTEKWQAAENSDLQVCLVGGGGGLASITRLLQTKPLQRVRARKKLRASEDTNTSLVQPQSPITSSSPRSNRTSSSSSADSYNISYNPADESINLV